MKRTFVEHGLSVLFVAAVFTLLIMVFQKDNGKTLPADAGLVGEYVSLEFLDFGDPLDKALFKETLNALSSDSSRGDSIVQAIDNFRREQFTNELYKTGAEERGLSWAKVRYLFPKYFEFIAVYIIVMVLSYYCAQTLGIIRFVQMKQGSSSYLAQLFFSIAQSNSRNIAFFGKAGVLLLKALVKGVAYVLLFSPAYVIAYSIKTEFRTDSTFFLVVLGVLSNGLLINYANRFYTFLVAESRKGYVDTAIVKSLNNSYAWHSPDGIAFASVVRLNKVFPSHVFQHIYMNARYQFHPTLKQHAAFLITGLVIIEMALNIQGHLGYEMLKNVLFKQYDVLLFIVFGIFSLVKLTEVLVDVWTMRDARRVENR